MVQRTLLRNWRRLELGRGSSYRGLGLGRDCLLSRNRDADYGTTPPHPNARLYPQVVGCTAREETGQLERHLDTDHTGDRDFAHTVVVLPSIRHSLSLSVYYQSLLQQSIPPIPQPHFFTTLLPEARLLGRTARASLLVG